jgi:uncharacterized protein YcbX
VKSFQGVRVDVLDLEADGPRGDRCWGVLDIEAETLLSAKRTGALLDAFVEGTDAVLPDAASAATVRGALGSAELDRALTAWLDRPVRLVHVDEEPTLHQSMSFDNENETSMVVRWRTPRGHYVDLFPLHFLVTSTVDAMRERHPELNWDVRRFRPNFVLDADVDERALFGATLRIGEVEVRVPEQLTERCVMTTRAQPLLGLVQQRSLLRTLARDAGKPDAALTAGSAVAELGLYGEIVTPGRIRVGDTVERIS